ncbi:hypothetical protein SMF1_0006 [Sulfolobales Mexican fusellovirus 1]|uniref:hypothetical protein n=1 Tax=Sulfolobales Mexican fusellovirus 1 TaxID=1298531 RepID=UPI0002C0CA9D|nr:hypothetical protein SMF1_0006 [Sulfolobales Mexican fusellovirus 1]AGG36553.1 hypothetical protein SMF1_0006 [Sulfolobales Mexican fusellovirus 1]
MSVYEEELKKAQNLAELKQKYEELQKQLQGNAKELKKLYKVYSRLEFEFKRKEFEKLKAELSQRKKKYAKEKLDINVKIIKKWYNSRLASAEHYVAMLQRGREGINIMYLKKVRLEENEGYLMLVDRKGRKSWIITAEPVLLDKAKFPWGRKLVALHFVLPEYPYTLGVALDDKLKNLIMQSVNAPTIIHSLIKTKFFEALARVSGGVDYTMLIIGAIMGVGIGLAIGFGISESNLAHLLAPHTVTNTTTAPHPTTKVAVS